MNSTSVQHETLDGIKEVSFWKVYILKIITMLSYPCLLLFFFAFLIIGACIFEYIESSVDLELKKEFLLKRAKLIEDIVNLANCSFLQDYNDSAELVMKFLLDFELHINSAPSPYDPSGQSFPLNWEFTNALFFTVTTVTTIGYGIIVPVTRIGKAVCMVYSIIGIPFAMYVYYEMGELLTHWIKALLVIFKKRKVKRTKMQERPKNIVTLSCTNLSADHKDSRPKIPESSEFPSDQSTITNGFKEAFTGRSTTIRPISEKAITEDYVDEVNHACIYLVLIVNLLVFGYILIFSIIASYSGGLTFYDAFYFSFITITTIGFGDIMPDRSGTWAQILGYISLVMLGLILTSFTINVMNEFLRITFQKLAAKYGCSK